MKLYMKSYSDLSRLSHIKKSFSHTSSDIVSSFFTSMLYVNQSFFRVEMKETLCVALNSKMELSKLTHESKKLVK